VEREFCDCDTHGARPETYVCGHMAEAACAGTTVGFVCYPADDDDGLTDAWCEACEQFLRRMVAIGLTERWKCPVGWPSCARIVISKRERLQRRKGGCTSSGKCPLPPIRDISGLGLLSTHCGHSVRCRSLMQ
jgi:hypothetical protein